MQQYGDWYTGRWWVGCYIWYSELGGAWAGSNFILFDVALYLPLNSKGLIRCSIAEDNLSCHRHHMRFFLYAHIASNTLFATAASLGPFSGSIQRYTKPLSFPSPRCLRCLFVSLFIIDARKSNRTTSNFVATILLRRDTFFLAYLLERLTNMNEN